jgi:hypothetical protein
MIRMRMLLPLVTAGCFWVPLGSDAVPAMGVDEVRRSSGSGAERVDGPGRELGGRGWFFEDSLIAFRTQANAARVRFRLWNKRGVPIRVVWSSGPVEEPRGRCPAAVAEWELRRTGDGAAPANVLRPGESREEHAVAVALVPMPEGGAWRPVPLSCVAGDPAGARAALRLAVETEGERYIYTFWYGAAGANPR